MGIFRHMSPRESDAGNLHVRFAEQDVERSDGSDIEAPPDERGANRDRLDLRSPRHIFTLPGSAEIRHHVERSERRRRITLTAHRSQLGTVAE